MMTSTPQTAAPNYTHDELAHSLKRLIQVRRDLKAYVANAEREIDDLHQLIERQVFEAFPGIAESVAYGDGDPIQFLVGDHRVRIYLVKNKPEVEIDRTPALDTTLDLFAEEDQ